MSDDKRNEWGIPRRACVDKFTPAERTIYDAVAAVEAAGCDERLTHAVNKLSEARALVADFVDGVPFGEGYPRPADEARAHLAEMVDTVIWMSGSSDFSPEGQAHEGWAKARPKLSAALDWLKANGGFRSTPTGSADR